MEEVLHMFDRNIMLMPLFNGWEWPRHFDLLLEPFTNCPINPFHEVVSRAHMADPKWPRCFEKARRHSAQQCGLAAMLSVLLSGRRAGWNGQGTPPGAGLLSRRGSHRACAALPPSLP